MTRALRTRNLHPVSRSGNLTESVSVEEHLPQRGNHRVSIQANREGGDHLDSWKEIAYHLKRAVRTVQRWERHEGLPVHRHPHRRANSVYAYRSELDDWWNREARAVEVKPIQTLSKGSPPKVEGSQRVKASYSQKGFRQIDPTLPKHLVECVLELRIASPCSRCCERAWLPYCINTNSHSAVSAGIRRREHDKRRQSASSLFVACCFLGGRSRVPV